MAPAHTASADARRCPCRAQRRGQWLVPLHHGFRHRLFGETYFQEGLFHQTEEMPIDRAVPRADVADGIRPRCCGRGRGGLEGPHPRRLRHLRRAAGAAAGRRGAADADHRRPVAGKARRLLRGAAGRAPRSPAGLRSRWRCRGAACARSRPISWSMRPGRFNPTATIPIAWCGRASRSASTISISPTARTSSRASPHSTPQARARGVFVLAGVSSFPVLTAAVVRQLAHGMARVDSDHRRHRAVALCQRRQNVIRAIASYAGKPVDVSAMAARRSAMPSSSSGATPSRRPAACRSDPSAFRWSMCRISRCCRSCGPVCASVWIGAGPGAGDSAPRAERVRLAGAAEAAALALCRSRR